MNIKGRMSPLHKRVRLSPREWYPDFHLYFTLLNFDAGKHENFFKIQCKVPIFVRSIPVEIRLLWGRWDNYNNYFLKFVPSGKIYIYIYIEEYIYSKLPSIRTLGGDGHLARRDVDGEIGRNTEAGNCIRFALRNPAT